jgi:hypothetical protein
VIVEQKEKMHQWSVVVRDNSLVLETPYTFGKYVRDVIDISDPAVIEYLQSIVINEAIEKGIEIDSKRNKQDNQ